MKKKICIFCSLSSFNTGMPISTYKLATGLKERGNFDVCAVLPCEGELATRLKNADINVMIIPFVRLRRRCLFNFLATWFRAGFKLYKHIKSNNINIVHFSDVIDAPFYIWAKLAGAKVVAHVRVCAGGRVVKFLYRVWTRIFCDRIITISEFTRKYYGFCRKRAAVVYNPGPDRSIFNAERYAKNKSTTDEPVVITVSMFRKEKGLHNFIKIATILKDRNDQKIKFIIVGGKVDGHEKYFEEMKKESNRLGIEIIENIPHEEVAHIMSKASVLLFVPEWEEALGGVVLEAMSLGIVPVAFNSGGIDECFTNGVSGFLVAKNDFEDAASKIETIINDNSYRVKIAEAARVEVDKKFTMQLYIDNAEKIYTKILDNSETDHAR